MGAGKYQDHEYFKPAELRVSPEERAVLTELVREHDEQELGQHPAATDR